MGARAKRGERWWSVSRGMRRAGHSIIGWDSLGQYSSDANAKKILRADSASPIVLSSPCLDTSEPTSLMAWGSRTSPSHEMLAESKLRT